VSQQRYEASRELQSKLEAETQHMADELDVNREKAQKLAKAEATIDKYQKKLEEMVTLKKQVCRYCCYDYYYYYYYYYY
jgi:predicted LPLAT superfamily acyltransferase